MDTQFLVAIGASAGGIEELHTFFDNTPPARVSYVIIQHLSPDYKSRMVEILSRYSQLKVCEAADNMQVEPDRVYMIPSQQYMIIRNRRLHLMDKEKTGMPHKTINTFFNSLARETGYNRVAVVLSGTGDDGSEGIVNISRAGGLVIVQDPATTQYDSMPANAVATGVADYIVAPATMPRIIAQYVNKSLNNNNLPAHSPDEETTAAAIVELIRERLPLDFSDYKPTTILRRIKRRMTYHNFREAGEYHHFLLQHPEEVETLAKSFMISVSSFFRNTEAFDIIANDVLPEIVKQKSDHDEIKVWVVGCATGEEAYTLAILLHEQLEKAGREINVKVFATDIDKAALQFAGKGVYPESIQAEISPERLAQFFTREDESYRVKPHIRKTLIFAQHNVVKDPPYCNMDLISCRNLLIYMNPPLQKKALSMLHFGLARDGFLFLGSSENGGMVLPYLTEIDRKWKIYRNLNTPKSVRFDIFTPSLLPELQAEVLAQAKKPGAAVNKSGLMEEVNLILLEEGRYAGVCIDKENYVVKSFGKAEEFLLQKIFNFDLMELLPQPLGLAFASASREARKNNERVIVSGIPVSVSGHPKAVTMIVRPLGDSDTDNRLLLVLFREDAALSENPVFDQEKYLSAGMLNLEEELKETRGRLQESMEKLAASNENMLSFNEELLSANEEMQSANEEMQSVNEELQTINTDYQLKIRELVVLNDDMDNYFRSDLNGQLFVDNELLLKKFSPAAIKLINLRESDVGRPISHITINIRNNDLERDIRNVIASGNPLSREVEAMNGNWYQMMIMPYIRQANNQQDGAIVSFNDITALKKAQYDLGRTNQSLKRINDDLDNFVHSASHDLLGPLTSIEGLMNLLTEKLDMANPEINMYSGMIRASITKFKENLRELAEIGKIESEMLKEPQLVDMEEMLDEVLFSIQSKIAAANASVIKNMNGTKLYFSRKNLRSILYNLISNAVKFRSPERPLEIHINTRKEDGFLLLDVRDNGIGLESGKVHSIFNMYKRLHPEVEGLGIGLYLVKKIVDASGGKTKVESEDGKGSTFSIFFKEKQEND
ncbi:chemotaxis protein CheB [Chitinophaga sp. XS-30]|uniref:chemotaxis protein CheB n=1 Tax=Chitinophaga sp. XS-30 TaxID=2604421 RepID=UPI0011DDE554|nr:chemotaxis protein CheB [Chitinophaga sp. XS-30]QEH39585.1 chemotaxis protein CheR [Chitinophaga sp. XS-30]